MLQLLWKDVKQVMWICVFCFEVNVYLSLNLCVKYFPVTGPFHSSLQKLRFSTASFVMTVVDPKCLNVCLVPI